jgi:hypothetical protein
MLKKVNDLVSIQNNGDGTESLIIDVPNMDCCVDPSELDEIRKDAKELMAQLQHIANYAEGRGYSMRCRLEGRMDLAPKFDAACESTYAKLPSWARW